MPSELRTPVSDRELERLLSDQNEWRAEGPLEPFRRVRDSTGIVKECATIETGACWRVRGEAVFSQRFVRHWTAIRLGQTLSGDLRVTIEAIAAMAPMANAIGDIRLEKTLIAFGRLSRARLANVQAPKKDAWSSGQIVEWLNDTGSRPGGTAPA